jgi:HAD superfamily hydrolase (TIGR01484 family)
MIAPLGVLYLKKLIIFDLDGTLAESKSALDSEMAVLLGRLIGVVKVAVISGGDWPQFEAQLLSNLSDDVDLANLYLLPTCGTKFFQYEGEWSKIYSEDFSQAERNEIVAAFQKALSISSFQPQQVWGELIEDRGSQITFSALGQQAPVDIKKVWDPDFAKRRKITEILTELLPGLSIRMGGSTSIDVTKQGIDKAYGIRKLRDRLDILIEEMIFVGDALFPGGNDYPAREAGVASIQVRDHNETKRVIEALLLCLGPASFQPGSRG